VHVAAVKRVRRGYRHWRGSAFINQQCFKAVDAADRYV
jgi:hypothetical protein